MTHVNAKSVDTLKREFEKIVDRKNPIMLEQKPEHPRDAKANAWYDAYYCHPNTSQAMTLQKRVRALAKDWPELYQKLLPIVQDAIAKQAEIMVAKDAAKQALADKKAARAAKLAEKAEIKRNPYHKLDPQVADILRQVAEPYRVAAVTMETTRLTGIRDQLVKLAAEKGSFDPYLVYPSSKNHYEEHANCFRRLEVQKFIDQKGYPVKYSLKKNTDKIIQDRAEQFAQDMVTAFIHKTGTKLSGIVEKKNGSHTVSIRGGSLQDHWMYFKFADGSEFDVQSQVVWKTSINGVHFPQFPTCFRNVKLSTGAKMELPSEAKMKEQFA